MLALALFSCTLFVLMGRLGKLTSIWPAIGTDVAEVDDMLLVESREEGFESVSLDLADG